MKISLDDLKKVELTGTTSLSGKEIDPDEALTAIIKVDEPDYIPEGVEVRARIDSTMFTGSFLARALKEIESDPKVKSIGLSRKLQMTEKS